MQTRVLRLMSARTYDDAARTLSQLISIEIIDNPTVTRLVQR